MFNQILFVSTKSGWGECLERSLTAEGYEVVTVASVEEARLHLGEAPDLVVVNAVGRPPAARAQVRELDWPVPVIVLTEDLAAMPVTEPLHYLASPFAIQDLLLLVQDTMHQRALGGRQPLYLSAALVEGIERVLQDLREKLRARCVVLSSSSGRLISSVGALEPGTAISLAALMAASFAASAQAAQIFADEDMFDSSLQESEGYGLYAIRLRDRLILSVAFSSQVTVGLVRHYAAQAAIDILELLVCEAEGSEVGEELTLDVDFRDTVFRALGDILED
jgi:DNA-binding response OmpR family regulator